VSDANSAEAESGRADRGEVRLDVDMTKSSSASLRGSGTGLLVETTSKAYRLWFSNPDLGLGTFMGSGVRPGDRGEWVDALSRMG
jgi:hypothetical protein